LPGAPGGVSTPPGTIPARKQRWFLPAGAPVHARPRAGASIAKQP
jgi:hypothetical protein